MPSLPPDLGYMGDKRRGASLGRPNRRTVCPQVERTFTLQRVRINSSGYDSGGAYWGLGQPLYWACADDNAGIDELFFRARDRAAAKLHLLTIYPNAKFYR